MSFLRFALVIALSSLAVTSTASAQWLGLVEASATLGTDGYPFTGAVPGEPADERWTDAHFADFDGDGVPDLMVGARFGLLRNANGGRMVPLRSLVGWRQRGDTGAEMWGDDVFRFVDIDGDGDLDAVQGGTAGALACQENVAWRWRERWVDPSRSALDIVPIDVERDGDVDLLVSIGACAQGPCGEPVELHLLINDGAGEFSDEVSLRGLALGIDETVVDVTVGDVDTDGFFDVITHRGTPTGSEVHVAINDGTGRFTDNALPLPTSCVGRGRSSALGDLDGDGFLDLVVARCATGQAPAEWAGPYTGGHPTITHVLALGSFSGFVDQSRVLLDAGGYVQELAGTEVALSDLDQDGDLDLLVLRLAGAGEMQHHLQIFLNEGIGRLRYSVTHSLFVPATASPGTGALDVIDLDGDGDEDVVLGFEGEGARVFLNRAANVTVPPRNVPTGLVAGALGGQMQLVWSPPEMAAAVRYFRVYRSLAHGMQLQDRELLAVIGGSRHLDVGFYATVDRNTQRALLADPNARVDLGTGRVSFIDQTASPGVAYFYSVTTVGPGHVESAPTPEVYGESLPVTVTDTQAPEITILSPTEQDWQRSPRIAIAFGDDLTEVAPDSVRVTFDTDLGPLLAGQDLSTMRMHRSDADAFIAYLEPPFELPADTTVTMTVAVSDFLGNEALEQVTFTTTPPAAPQPTPMLPVAVMEEPVVLNAAPVSVRFDGTGSSDPDGELLRHEWYFLDSDPLSGVVADHPTGYGAETEHFFEYGGNYTVTLVVRDADGNVASTSRALIIDGPERSDAGVPMTDGGRPFDAGPCIPQCGSMTCGPDNCGGLCGTCTARQECVDNRCQCAAGETACGDICGVDLQTDRDNCGACSVRCNIGSVCRAGSCVEGPGVGGCGCRAGADPRAPSPPTPLLWLLLLLGLRYLPTAARRSSTIVSAMR